ncbi:heme A synthase [Spirosoma sp. KNUC1025]|uniref:COX15/CtaA family protein n=1 Tax=Spirosoma sp. KNUC1025 TaxID=2894082 RepID=UPI0038687327|nr:COX15/CtaA family protein [Spirosoma sp. KNUC1025]
MTSSISLIDKREQRFRSLVLLTILVIYLVVLAGGIVRGTGSGMGCPDWPKCFGRWVPPTEISQLPANYQTIYGAKLKGEIEFNAVKTWIEYINRLLGVLAGFFVFGTLIASLSYLRKDKVVFWGSFLSFLLLGLNGWLGSRVVATELAQYLISLHLLLAIAVVFTLLFVFVRSNTSLLKFEPKQKKVKALRLLLLVIMLLTLFQTALGTQVRDALDQVVKQLGYGQREKWIEGLNWSFYVHRSFSLIVLAFHIAVIYQLRSVSQNGSIKRVVNGLIVLVILEIGTGVIMAYMNVPAAAQPIHLLLAVLIMGLQFMAWLLVNPALIEPKMNNRATQLIEI